jgi:hypothetical protein
MLSGRDRKFIGTVVGSMQLAVVLVHETLAPSSRQCQISAASIVCCMFVLIISMTSHDMGDHTCCVYATI